MALRHALRTVTRPVADGLPLHWQQRLRGRVAHLVDRLPGRTRDALGVVALRAPSRWWWAVVAFLWTLVEIAIVVGAGWLTGLFVIAWLQLPDPPTPQLGTVPWPTVLVLAGVPLWLLFRGVRGLGLRRGARRHARRIRVRLRERVDEAVEAGLVDLRKEVDARDRLLELVSGLRRQ